jgi:hypothetical protein
MKAALLFPSCNFIYVQKQLNFYRNHRVASWICRIRALNRIGASEPGLLKDVVVPRDPWGKQQSGVPVCGTYPDADSDFQIRMMRIRIRIKMFSDF